MMPVNSAGEPLSRNRDALPVSLSPNMNASELAADRPWDLSLMMIITGRPTAGPASHVPPQCEAVERPPVQAHSFSPPIGRARNYFTILFKTGGDIYKSPAQFILNGWNKNK